MSEPHTPGGQLFLSFSGIDGAGKSTQITRLTHTLQQAGMRVNLVTFWDDVVALRSFREEMGHRVFKGDRGVGSPAAPIRRADKNVKSPLLTLFRMAMYVLDALSLGLAVNRLRRESPGPRADVIVFDRFIYDELANLNLHSPLISIYVRTLLWLAPKPDLAFVLDADPAAAFARKPEYPLDFLHSNRIAYLELAGIAGIKVIPPSSIDEAQKAILSLVLQTSNPSLPQIDFLHRDHDPEVRLEPSLRR